MSENDNLSSLSKVIPTLTGTENFVVWRRALRAYLLEKGALRVLEGRETEPFRVDPLPSADNRDEAMYGPHAGIEPPYAQTSSTTADLTVAQMKQWDAWETKERKARSTLILTISSALAAEVENLWSAHDIYSRLCTEHKVDTVERRGDLFQRIMFLQLSANSPRDKMIEHLETYTNLASEVVQAGAPFPEWQKCQTFLSSLGNDLETLKIQFNVLPEDRQTWMELSRTYKTLADRRGFEQDRQAKINALINKDATRGGPRKGTENKGNKGDGKGDGKSKGKGGGGNNDSKGKAENKKKCTWCDFKGHTQEECRKKAAGEPSKADIKAAAKQLAEKRTKGETNATINSIDGWISNPNLIAHVSTGPMLTHEFLIDSGASHHITPSRMLLTDIVALPHTMHFGLADTNTVIRSQEKGSLTLTTPGGTAFKVTDVYLVPNVRTHILSEGVLKSQGWDVDLRENMLTYKGHTFKVTRRGVLPYIKITPKGLAAAAVTMTPLHLLHRRLGHQSPQTIIELAKDGLINADVTSLNSTTCHGSSSTAPRVTCSSGGSCGTHGTKAANTCTGTGSYAETTYAASAASPFLATCTG
ncbi:hypothetical protein JCM24511_08794 [Saitozyma sp. JCM 24511]|nr:hypothetical protein JCM24511_08794 [Saitozyma sp. JCM 24511]